jgi:N6-L-threonylcarbamoyladenine synthase
LVQKGLAMASGRPLIAVNRLEAHALSPRLIDADLQFPYLHLLMLVAIAIALPSLI